MLAIECIEQLRAISSRNAKIEILKEALQYPTIAKVFQAAYNPFVTYGVVKTLPCNTGSGHLEDSPLTFEGLLNQLAARELTGNAALLAIQQFMNCLTAEDQKVFLGILDGDLRCGVTDSSVNKACKNLIPVFEPMLATPEDEGISKMTFPCIIEPKMDGYRCLAIYDSVSVSFVSRSGKAFTTLDHLADEIVRLAAGEALVFDCEVMGKGGFNDTASAVKRKEAKTQDTTLHVFDVMKFSDFQARNSTSGMAQLGRCKWLDELFSKYSGPLIRNPWKVVDSISDARNQFEDYIESGREGAILKALRARYEFKRSKSWVKMKKHIDSLDLEIIGFEEGTGKNVGRLGAIVVDYKGKSVKVGIGFSDDQRQQFWDERTEMVGDLIEIEAMEETKDGSLRHPAFKNLRTFKGAKI